MADLERTANSMLTSLYLISSRKVLRSKTISMTALGRIIESKNLQLPTLQANTSVSFWTWWERFNELTQSLNEIISKYSNLNLNQKSPSGIGELDDPYRLKIIKGGMGSAVRQRFIVTINCF